MNNIDEFRVLRFNEIKKNVRIIEKIQKKQKKTKKKFNFILSISIIYMKKSIEMFELLNIIKKNEKKK